MVLSGEQIKSAPKPARLDSPNPHGYQLCFLKNFTDMIKMITLPTNCPLLRLEDRTVFVPMETQQLDLALCKDALEFVSEETCPDAVQYLLAEADVTQNTLLSFSP